MDVNGLREHIDKRFDRFEEKLDGHTERLARNEADVSWLKGSTKIIVAIVMSAAGFLASLYFTS